MTEFNIEVVASAIGIPISEWPGNCNGISLAMLAVDGLVPTETQNHYGHWHGPTTDRWFRWSIAPFQRHGWLALPDGTIIDPTRWCFTGEDPYIYVGPDSDDYDWGGAALRSAMQGPFPIECEHDKCRDERVELTPLFIEEVLPKDYFGDTFEPEDWEPDATHGQTNATLRSCQVFWIANLAPNKLGSDGRAIINYLIKHGHKSMVPMDTRQWATGARSAIGKLS